MNETIQQRDERVRQQWQYIHILMRRAIACPRPGDDEELATIVKALGVDRETLAKDAARFGKLELACATGDYVKVQNFIDTRQKNHIDDWMNQYPSQW